MFLRRLLGAVPNQSLAILGFHNLTPTPSQPAVPAHFPRSFDRLVRLLSRRYECVTVSEGVRRLQSGQPLQRPLVAIIFDDGYADVYHVARPILNRHGIKATAYVVVESLVSGQLPWYEVLGALIFQGPAETLEIKCPDLVHQVSRPVSPNTRHQVYWDAVRHLKTHFVNGLPAALSELARREQISLESPPGGFPFMLNVEQARILVKEGFEIGSHSLSHPILPNLKDEALRHEIVDSRLELGRLIGQPVTSFCFPNGDNDERCRQLVLSAGYEAAVSMECGANHAAELPTFRLRRIPLSENPHALWPYHSLLRIRSTLLD